MKMTIFDYIKTYVKHPRLIIDAFLDAIDDAKQKRFLRNKFAAYEYEKRNYDDVIVMSSYEYYVPENKYKRSIYNPMIVVWHELEKMFDNGKGYSTIRRMGIMGIHIDTQNEDLLTVAISLKRPGLLIGNGGSNISELESRLTYLFNRKTEIKIAEVKKDINEPMYIGY